MKSNKINLAIWHALTQFTRTSIIENYTRNQVTFLDKMHWCISRNHHTPWTYNLYIFIFLQYYTREEFDCDYYGCQNRIINMEVIPNLNYLSNWVTNHYIHERVGTIKEDLIQRQCRQIVRDKGMGIAEAGLYLFLSLS